MEHFIEPEPPIKTPDDFGGWEKCCQFCVPAGIGDVSWIYSKIRHIPSMLGKIVILYAGSRDLAPVLHRAHPLIEMMPDVHWGGYMPQRESWEVVAQSLPSEWPDHFGWGPLHHKRVMNLSANLHLEMGRKLSEWLPLLPTDYHYHLDIKLEHQQNGDNLLGGLSGPFIAVYTSNRDKSDQPSGWALWDSDEWIGFLTRISKLPELKRCTFLILGASYDADRSEAVATGLERCGLSVVRVLGQPLGVALHCLSRSHYFFAYPSGIGILANVLRVPGVMFLPWLLSNLENAYADPNDMALSVYRAWSDPRPDEVYDWFARVGLKQAMLCGGKNW